MNKNKNSANKTVLFTQNESKRKGQREKSIKRREGQTSWLRAITYTQTWTNISSVCNSWAKVKEDSSVLNSQNSLGLITPKANPNELSWDLKAFEMCLEVVKANIIFKGCDLFKRNRKYILALISHICHYLLNVNIGIVSIVEIKSKEERFTSRQIQDIWGDNVEIIRCGTYLEEAMYDIYPVRDSVSPRYAQISVIQRTWIA